MKNTFTHALLIFVSISGFAVQAQQPLSCSETVEQYRTGQTSIVDDHLIACIQYALKEEKELHAQKERSLCGQSTYAFGSFIESAASVAQKYAKACAVAVITGELFLRAPIYTNKKYRALYEKEIRKINKDVHFWTVTWAAFFLGEICGGNYASRLLSHSASKVHALSRYLFKTSNEKISELEKLLEKALSEKNNIKLVS